MSQVKAENEAYVGGIRLWKSETLAREPVGSEKDTDIGKLWLIFLELVGHDVDNSIQKLELVNLDANTTECECDAALEKDETKSKHTCSCTGSGAIVTFRSNLAVGKLKKQLSDHKNWHPQGLSDQGKRQPDGSVEFCEHCCFKNKQLKWISKKPIAGRAIQEEDFQEDCLKAATTNDQIKAFEMILVTVLGPWSLDYIAVVKDAIKDLKLRDARAQVLKSLHDILGEPENQEDIPKERGTDEIEKIVRKTVDDLIVKKPDGVDLKEVKEWTRKYQKDPETITVDEEEDEEDVTKDGNLPPLPISAPPLAEKKDATEENLKEAIRSLKNEVEDANNLVIAAGVENIAKNTKEGLETKISVMQQIYSDMKSEEADKFKAEYSTQKKNAIEALITLARGIEFIEFKSGAGVVGSKDSSREKEEDVPDEDEVKEALSHFARQQISFNEGKQEVNDLLETSESQVKRVDFDVVVTRISPSIEKILEKMVKSADQFKKWRKLKSTDLTESSRKSINLCISKANAAQEEWHTMG